MVKVCTALNIVKLNMIVIITIATKCHQSVSGVKITRLGSVGIIWAGYERAYFTWHLTVVIYMRKS